MADNKAPEVQVDPVLQEELQELEQKFEPTAKPEEKKNESNLNILEKDGDLYLRSESDDVEFDVDPDKGQPIQRLTDSDDHSTDGSETSSFEGKTREDLIKSLEDSQKMIGDQSSEIGDLRKLTANDEDLSEAELLERLTANDISDALLTEKTKLDEIDPYDLETVDEQKGVIMEMENDLINKRAQEHIQARFDNRDNESFVSTMKQRFKDDGIEIEEDDFNVVSKEARSYAENGLLTERSYHKAMIDKFGVDQVTKYYQMSGERKARNDIQNASAKQTEKVDVRGTGKNAKMTRIADLSTKEIRSTLDNLSVDELQRLYGQLNK